MRPLTRTPDSYGQETKAGWLQRSVRTGGHGQQGNELAEYVNTKTAKDVDMEFWKDNRAFVTTAVQSHLSCPLRTSVFIGQRACLQHCLLEKRRTNLSPDSTNSLQFLHGNMQIWQFCFWWVISGSSTNCRWIYSLIPHTSHNTEVPQLVAVWRRTSDQVQQASQ